MPTSPDADDFRALLLESPKSATAGHTGRVRAGVKGGRGGGVMPLAEMGASHARNTQDQLAFRRKRGIEQDVSGLDVAVQDRWGSLMQEIEPCDDIFNNWHEHVHF